MNKTIQKIIDETEKKLQEEIDMLDWYVRKAAQTQSAIEEMKQTLDELRTIG